MRVAPLIESVGSVIRLSSEQALNERSPPIAIIAYINFFIVVSPFF